MLDRLTTVKNKLNEAISQLCDVSWMFAKHPGRDFTRERKLPFRKVVSLLLSMEGGTLTTELLKYLGCSAEIASAPAFVQQGDKISEAAFPSLFDLFVRKTDSPKLYKGFRLLAADVSDIQDILNSRGIAAGLDLPGTEEFDISLQLRLTTKQTNETKRLCKNRNEYKYIRSNVTFDYLPKKNRNQSFWSALY